MFGSSDRSVLVAISLFGFALICWRIALFAFQRRVRRLRSNNPPGPTGEPIPNDSEVAELKTLDEEQQDLDLAERPSKSLPLLIPGSSFRDEQRPGDDPRRVGLFFAMNRKRTVQSSDETFSGERDDHLTWGVTSVRIPEAHRFGQIELPWKFKILSVELFPEDPSKHFVNGGFVELEQEEWAELASTYPANEALIFVHGFNTSFLESIYRTAQIVWDIKFSGISICFSWPSRGQASSYVYDRDSALGAREHFLNVLQTVARIENLAKVHILAHSMGNFIVLDALAQQIFGPNTSKLGEVMMAAPDVDRDHYRLTASRVSNLVAGMTLYASSADKALRVSKMLAGDISRAGDVPNDGPIVLPNIDTIDVTALGDEMFGFNHSVFAQSRSILNDVSVLVRTQHRPPHERVADIRPVPEGASKPTYWQYAP